MRSELLYNSIEMNELTFYSHGKKALFILIILIIVVLTVIYFVLPKGFLSALMTTVIFVLMAIFSLPIKYVLTDANTIEFHFLLGKVKSRTIRVDSIIETWVKNNRLTIKYVKEGYSQPSSSILELEKRNIKKIQEELLKRNPNIIEVNEFPPRLP